MEGGVTFSGPMADPENMAARLQLDHVDFRTNGTNSPTGSPALRKVELQNEGPVVIALNQDVVRIEKMRVSGRNTALNASGSVNLRDALEPLALNLDAQVDLALLQDADRDFYSSGSLTMNTSVRGSFAQPRANGRIELKNANVNYTGAPNGLSNANGVILLNGTNASIQRLTGESGGGQIALTGFVGLGSRVPSFNLKAAVARVRVRYSGISTTSNAQPFAYGQSPSVVGLRNSQRRANCLRQFERCRVASLRGVYTAQHACLTESPPGGNAIGCSHPDSSRLTGCFYLRKPPLSLGESELARHR